MPQTPYSQEDVVQRGQTLYEQQIRSHVEPQCNGKMLVVDVDTGHYEIDSDTLAALDRARALHPTANLYVLRVGYPTAVKLGGRFTWL